ncbi:MAG TPA: hypothetical protein VHN99_00645 [Deinococcales bacterium]|nr:hypothetical protein [Deinococcales bacterium]
MTSYPETAAAAIQAAYPDRPDLQRAAWREQFPSRPMPAGFGDTSKPRARAAALHIGQAMQQGEGGVKATVVLTGWLMTVPDECRSLNAIRDPWARNADTKRWEGILAAELVRLRPPTPAPERAALAVTRRFAGRQRELDHDDFVGGCKGLIDALKRLGWLLDDSPAHVTVTYRQERADRSGTAVLWELERGEP